MEQRTITHKQKLDDNFRFWGKLVILSIYITQPFGKLGSIDLPFIEVLSTLKLQCFFQVIWQITFVVCSIGVLSRKWSKVCMFLVGILLLMAVLANGFLYSNNLVFSSCLLIAMSMSSYEQNFVRYQLFVVYLGAFLDKLFFDHWRNGYFMESYFENNWYVSIAEGLIGSESISQMMGTGTIVVEAILALLVLLPRATKLFILLGVSFHLSTAVLMHSFFGLFIPCILMCYMSLVPAKLEFNKRLPKLKKIKMFSNFYLMAWRRIIQKTIFSLARSTFVWIVLAYILTACPFPLKMLSALVWFGLMMASLNDSILNRNVQT